MLDSAGPRWGLTVPLTGLSLPDHADLIRALPAWGYTDLWSSEVAGSDAFTPLALASTWTDGLRLGTAIASVYTRGPALLAMSAAALAEAAPGRFVLGLGAASPAVVESWNGMSFDRPYEHTRDVLRVVRAALAGERVDYSGPTLRVDGFRLERPPELAPPILLAALRPRMLRLAGQEADGAILNWLSAEDVTRCVAEMVAPAGDGGLGSAEVVARIFVCPTEDADHARAVGRRLIAAYLTVPAYAAFHAWLGRDLSGLQQAWAAGDRRAAVASITNDVVDALIVHGSPAQCRARVAEYVGHGVTTPVLALLPTPETGPDTLAGVLEQLGPDGEPPMHLRDAVVVITGAGSGIGAAMARRFSAEGAAVVVVTDLDAAAADRVAASIGAPAAGLDVTNARAVAGLVARVVDDYGRIDLFCSNAGVALGGGLDAGAEVWRRAWDVNVMAHVHAAQAVLPVMRDQGHGYLLQTCSAAGLLSAPGDPSYTATKHAAVAFAEWLALTYASDGIRVSALCPLGVDTPLLMSPLAAGDTAAAVVAASGPIISADQVAESVVRGLDEERFLILPHPEVAKYWARKAADPDRWLAAMTSSFE